MSYYQNCLEMIGNTPMIEIHGFDTGPCRLFGKLESKNPGGSIKDRIALSMINCAEAEGKIKPGDTLIEATAGNTGLGLALVAAQKGYRLLIVMPDKMSKEKITHLRALGAEVIMTRSDVAKGHPEYYQDLAETIQKRTPNSYYINQFANHHNVKAHYESTGPEIWQQMEHDVDAVVCGVGTGGTISGVGRYLAEVAPEAEMVLADPQGSILTPYLETGVLPKKSSVWLVEGIGEDFIPSICNLDYAKHAYAISDTESFQHARQLLQTDGIIVGSSSGTILAAAVKYCQAQTKTKRVVAFLCDDGNKYLSKVYNDYWLLDQGLMQREKFGDLRDIALRRHADKAVITARPEESLLLVLKRMKLHEISQVPILIDDEIHGLIDENILLSATLANTENLHRTAENFMQTDFASLNSSASLAELQSLLQQYNVVIITTANKFFGLITRIDLLSYLQRQQNL